MNRWTTVKLREYYREIGVNYREIGVNYREIGVK